MTHPCTTAHPVCYLALDSAFLTLHFFRRGISQPNSQHDWRESSSPGLEEIGERFYCNSQSIPNCPSVRIKYTYALLHLVTLDYGQHNDQNHGSLCLPPFWPENTEAYDLLSWRLELQAAPHRRHEQPMFVMVVNALPKQSLSRTVLDLITEIKTASFNPILHTWF